MRSSRFCVKSVKVDWVWLLQAFMLIYLYECLCQMRGVQQSRCWRGRVAGKYWKNWAGYIRSRNSNERHTELHLIMQKFEKKKTQVQKWIPRICFLCSRPCLSLSLHIDLCQFAILCNDITVFLMRFGKPAQCFRQHEFSHDVGARKKSRNWWKTEDAFSCSLH